MYGVETKNLNKAVKRNMARFAKERGRHLKYMPYAFTEMGVAMLSSVLRSDAAININRNIMRAFVTMRNYVSTVSAASAELSQFKERLKLIEKSCKDNADAVTDLSEDMQKDMDDIYLALSQLAAKQKDTEAGKSRVKIGFKK